MFVTVGDAQIFAVAFGATTQPAIIGIGGWIGSWELWVAPFSTLSQNWRTIAYDHRGTGATVAPPASITATRLVDDVFAVLDAYGVERCVLAAESSGALTALAAALRHPQRIRGLVIVDGFVFGDTPPIKDPFLTGLRRDYAATLDRFVTACVPEPDSDHIKRWGRQIVDRATQEAAIALFLATDVDLRRDLHRIVQPTLIIHGAADTLVPQSAARRLAAALPHAQLQILEGAGHVPTMTRPAEVAQAIAHFFHMEAAG